MKNNSFVARHRSFSKLFWSRFQTHYFLSNDPFKQILMVSSRGMLVNNEIISRLAIKQLKFCWRIPLAKPNESLTLRSLKVKSFKYRNKKLSYLICGCPNGCKNWSKSREVIINFFMDFCNTIKDSRLNTNRE